MVLAQMKAVIALANISITDRVIQGGQNCLLRLLPARSDAVLLEVTVGPYTRILCLWAPGLDDKKTHPLLPWSFVEHLLSQEVLTSKPSGNIWPMKLPIKTTMHFQLRQGHLLKGHKFRKLCYRNRGLVMPEPGGSNVLILCVSEISPYSLYFYLISIFPPLVHKDRQRSFIAQLEDPLTFL